MFVYLFFVFFLQMIIQNLTMYQLYEVKVAAATFSIINPKKIILGKFSEGKKVSEIDFY